MQKRNQIVHLMLIILPVFLVFSCSKNQDASSTPIIIQERIDILTDPGLQNQSTSSRIGYALRVNTGFYVINQDTGASTDVATYSAALPIGEQFRVLSDPRAAVYQGTSYNFIAVQRESGQDGYIIASNIADGGTLGVIVDDSARIYSGPNNLNVTNSILSKKTILVYYPETEKDGFVEFKAYDPVQKVTFGSSSIAYIKPPVISTKRSDIESSKLLQTAQSLDANRDKVRIEALLESAVMDYPDSQFADEIWSILNPNAAVRIQTRAAASTYMYANSENVNVYNSPDAVTGRVISLLDEDTDVVVLEETVENYLVNGVSAKWYHITSPVEGWVFGHWLTSWQ